MRPSLQSLNHRHLSGRRRFGLLAAACVGAIAVASYAVSPSSGAEPAATPIVTTGPATVHGQSEVTLTATISDGGSPAVYRFQIQPDYEWFDETPEEAFSRSTTTGYATQTQAIPSSLERQYVSAVFAPPPQHSHYAYRAVLEVNGSEQVFGQPLAFEVAIKLLPSLPMERSPSEGSATNTQGPSTGQTDPSADPPIDCRVPSLRTLTLAQARHLIASTHCGALRIVGRQAVRSSRIVAQSPHPHAIMARSAQITVWLRNSNHAYRP
jgi:hypothetical protein